jgi:hypothetical protein
MMRKKATKRENRRKLQHICLVCDGIGLDLDGNGLAGQNTFAKIDGACGRSQDFGTVLVAEIESSVEKRTTAATAERDAKYAILPACHIHAIRSRHDELG